MSASSRVPPPGGLSTRSTPPTDATRSARPRNPDPLSAGSPRPSSLTSTKSRPGNLRISTWAPSARAARPRWPALRRRRIRGGLDRRGEPLVRHRGDRVGTGERSTRAWTAPVSPVSVSTAGWIPRASSRSSVSASRASLLAESINDPSSGSAAAARSRPSPAPGSRSPAAAAPRHADRVPAAPFASPASTIRVREARTCSSWASHLGLQPGVLQSHARRGRRQLDQLRLKLQAFVVDQTASTPATGAMARPESGPATATA